MSFRPFLLIEATVQLFTSFIRKIKKPISSVSRIFVKCTLQIQISMFICQLSISKISCIIVNLQLNYSLRILKIEMCNQTKILTNCVIRLQAIIFVITKICANRKLPFLQFASYLDCPVCNRR